MKMEPKNQAGKETLQPCLEMLKSYLNTARITNTQRSLNHNNAHIYLQILK